MKIGLATILRMQWLVLEPGRHFLVDQGPAMRCLLRGAGTTARETTYYAMDGKLKGQPDVVVGNEIRDYKSGSVLEDSPDGLKKVKEGYVRQLRLYGYLVKENTGTSPRKGKLLPMQGNPVEIELTPEDCEAEAQRAISLLDALNSAISATIALISSQERPRNPAIGAATKRIARRFGQTSQRVGGMKATTQLSQVAS